MKHKGIGDLDPSFLLLVVSEHLRDSSLLLHDHMAYHVRRGAVGMARVPRTTDPTALPDAADHSGSSMPARLHGAPLAD